MFIAALFLQESRHGGNLSVHGKRNRWIKEDKGVDRQRKIDKRIIYMNTYTYIYMCAHTHIYTTHILVIKKKKIMSFAAT